ncbi:MAG TPA: NADH-quinone oxidoreductase subunit C [Bryobacteraceae bacterium]|jgi:NADH-quinone oxidoreductase subunit C|nr:NADH-quinone oxidoreductase subunit C [Bryobacteraceae bacterium]
MIPENLREDPVASALDDVAVTAKFEFNELTVEIAPENILEALRRIKHQLRFERLSTVTAVDRYPAEPRFEIVYHLQSIAGKQYLRLKARVSGENPEIESAFAVYRAANWYEREVFDLYGVRFLNHPNLTRIMLPDDWVGYPLRKDVPVTGTRY